MKTKLQPLELGFTGLASRNNFSLKTETNSYMLKISSNKHVVVDGIHWEIWVYSNIRGNYSILTTFKDCNNYDIEDKLSYIRDKSILADLFNYINVYFRKRTIDTILKQLL